MLAPPPILRPVNPSDTGAILTILNGFRTGSPQIREADFRTLLDCPFQSPGSPSGYVIEALGCVVGFLATLFSERWISRERRNFCNISSWIVDPQYRKYSILLLKPVLELKDHTITCFTPSPHVYPILRRLGFVDLDESTTELFPRILKPLPSFGTLSGLRQIRRLDLDDPSIPPEKHELIQDHQPLGISFLLLSDGISSCLIGFAKTVSYRFNYAVLLHISDTEFFRRHIHEIRLHLWRTAKTLRLSAPTRFLNGHVFPHSTVRSLSHPPLFKCDRLKPEEIDNLYSELAILQDF
jgi:hypothetical protein